MPIDTPHESVVAAAPEWQKVRDVLKGPAAVKATERRTVYLPRLPGQRIVVVPGVGNVDEYLLYLDRAVLLSGFAERVLHGLVGMAMRKPPAVTVPAVMEQDLENITLDGTTFAGFAKDVLTEDLSTSWGGILVDWSESFARPYLRRYCAEAVLNWRLEYRGGQPVTTRLVLSEPILVPDPKDEWQDKCIKQLRVLELVPSAFTVDLPDEYPFGHLVHRVFQKEESGTKQDEWIELPPFIPTRRERPLGFIPFQPFNALNALWQCGRPAILNLINMILSCYKNSADYENAIHCAGVPTLAVWGIRKVQAGAPQTTGQIEIGPGRVITGEDPAGHAEYVQTGGQGAAEIKAAMEDKKAEMATMAARLLLSRDRRVAETAEAQRIGFAADDASLTTVVDAVEQALTNACAWHAWWAGPYATVDEAAHEVAIKLNREFLETQLPADELNRLGVEVDANRLPLEDYFVNGQRGGLIRPDLTYEEYQAELAKGNSADTSVTAETQAGLAALTRALARGDMRAIEDAAASLKILLSTAPED